VDFAMFTHVRFLIAVGTGDGAPNPAPVLVLVVLLSQKTFLRHVGNRTDAVCLPADKRIEWSADGQTAISGTTVTGRNVNATEQHQGRSRHRPKIAFNVLGGR
jgi:hypothetical protein